MLASALQVMRDDHSNSRITKWSLVCTHLSWSDLICFWKRGYSFTIHVNASSVPDVFHLWPIDQDGFGLRFSTPVAHYTLAMYSSRECREDMASGPAHSDRIYFSSWIGHWGSYAKGRKKWLVQLVQRALILFFFLFLFLFLLFFENLLLIPVTFPFCISWRVGSH